MSMRLRYVNLKPALSQLELVSLIGNGKLFWVCWALGVRAEMRVWIH